MSNQLECELTCGCKVKKDRKNAKAGADTYCPRHGISQIGIVHASAWRLICLDCRIGEWWGQDRSGAEKSVHHHANKKGHDAVAIYDDGTPAKILRKKLSTERAEVLDLFSTTSQPAETPPPF